MATPPPITALERQLILHQCLSGRLPTHPGKTHWKRSELQVAVEEELNRRYGPAEPIEFGKDAILNDLKQMRTLLRAPINTPKGPQATYFYHDPYYNVFEHIELLGTEAEELDTATELLVNKFGSLPLAMRIEDFLGRLRKRLPADYSYLEDGSVLYDHRLSFSEPQYFQQCLEGIKNRQTLLFRYQRFGEQAPKPLYVLPAVLKEYRGRWYIFGELRPAGELSLLALDRVQQVTPTGEPGNGELKALRKQVHQYLDSRIGVSGLAEKPQSVRFWCNAWQIHYLASRKLHPTQYIDYRTDGSAEVTLFVALNYELLHSLLELGNAIEVLHPPALRQQYRQAVQAMLHQHPPEADAD